MRRMLWNLVYKYILGEPESLDEITTKWLRVNGKKYSDLSMKDILTNDFLKRTR